MSRPGLSGVGNRTGRASLEPFLEAIVERFIDSGFKAIGVSCKDELGKEFIEKRVDRDFLKEI